MNTRGNPKRLVAAQPGNLNAVKQRVHSPRLIQARAAEIASELTRSFEFSPAERLAAHEAARCPRSGCDRDRRRPTRRAERTARARAEGHEQLSRAAGAARADGARARDP
jgi:hypothetical protein